MKVSTFFAGMSLLLLAGFFAVDGQVTLLERCAAAKKRFGCKKVKEKNVQLCVFKQGCKPKSCSSFKKAACQKVSHCQYKPKLEKCAAKQAAGGDTCEKDLVAAEAAMKKAQAGALAGEKNLGLAIAEIAELKEDVKELSMEVKKGSLIAAVAQKELASANVEIAELKEDIKDLSVEVKKGIERAVVAEKELASANAEIAELKEDIGNLSVEVKKGIDRAAAAEKELASAQAQADEAHKSYKLMLSLDIGAIVLQCPTDELVMFRAKTIMEAQKPLKNVRDIMIGKTEDCPPGDFAISDASAIALGNALEKYGDSTFLFDSVMIVNQGFSDEASEALAKGLMQLRFRKLMYFVEGTGDKTMRVFIDMFKKGGFDQFWVDYGTASPELRKEMRDEQIKQGKTSFLFTNPFVIQP